MVSVFGEGETTRQPIKDMRWCGQSVTRKRRAKEKVARDRRSYSGVVGEFRRDDTAMELRSKTPKNGSSARVR